MVLDLINQPYAASFLQSTPVILWPWGPFLISLSKLLISCLFIFPKTRSIPYIQPVTVLIGVETYQNYTWIYEFRFFWILLSNPDNPFELYLFIFLPTISHTSFCFIFREWIETSGFPISVICFELKLNTFKVSSKTFEYLSKCKLEISVYNIFLVPKLTYRS